MRYKNSSQLLGLGADIWRAEPQYNSPKETWSLVFDI